MKKMILVLVACALVSGCASPKEMGTPGETPVSGEHSVSKVSSITAEYAASDGLTEFLLNSYYLPVENPVHSYLQNNSIRRFFNMWYKEYTGEDTEPHWNYDTLAPVLLLDHDFQTLPQEDKGLYTCTYSTDDGPTGYIIVSYGESAEGPYISKWSLCESTPYQYDLRANEEQIAAALKKTDLDLSTVSAERTEWIDMETNREDSVILFTDGKGDRYILCFGSGDYTVEKQ